MSFSYAGQNYMKFKLISLMLVFSILYVFSYQLYGQQPQSPEKSELVRADSLKQAEQQLENAQKEKDAATIDYAKYKSREAKETAKEAQRVEGDASKSAKEAQKALRTEKKAQKARVKANKQAEKATDAKEKSDQNF